MSSHFEICPTSGNSRATSIVISSSSDKHLLTYLLILPVFVIAETSFIFPAAVERVVRHSVASARGR